MKPRPTKIQPGATLWNPNAGPDWYAKSLAGQWMYFDAEEGDWDNGQWVLSIGVNLSDLIPVEHLMAQHNGANSLSPEVIQEKLDNNRFGVTVPEWNGEGLPPVGTECRINHERLAYDNARITYMGKGVFCYEASGTEYTGSTYDAAFYPIKTEREIAIEAMNPIICSQGMFSADGDACKAISAALYDAGYRKVEK
jgi:hypothetical protein